MSSIRIDSSEWIPGALLIGEVGLGVLGSAIPSTGDNGPGYAYNDLSLPADAGKEICGRITTWPTAGALYAYEDTSFTFTGAPDGAYSFAYQLYVDGIATGSPTTVALNVGVTAVTGAASWSESNDTAAVSGVVGNGVVGNAAWSETSDTCAALATIRVDASIGWAEASDTAMLTGSLAGSLPVSGTVSWAEANDSASIAGSVAINVSGLVSWTEANDAIAITAASDLVFARAPSGSGYSPKRRETQTRPANVQRNYR